jgi:tetratricopeptide (TPR) repeat protein
MKKYFYVKENKQFGPFSLEELKDKFIEKTTLVWTEGMNDWKEAESLTDLNEILYVTPPPIPVDFNKKNEVVQITDISNYKNNSIYDLTYKREVEATIFGLLLLFIPLFINEFFRDYKFHSITEINQFRVLVSIIGIIVRLGVVYRVGIIANRQNRAVKTWKWFSFFLPSISLIIIGLLRKLKLSIKIDGNLPQKVQLDILNNKAKMLYNEKRYKECIDVINHALKIDSNNLDSMFLIAKSNFELELFDDSKRYFQFLMDNKYKISVVLFYIGNIEVALNNKTKAIDCWQKSFELGFSLSEKKLNFYHNYTDVFILEKKDVIKKLGQKNEGLIIYYGSVKYLNGNLQTEKNKKAQINIFENGINIEFRNVFNIKNYAIGFYEIKSISVLDENNCFEISLNNGEILTFQYLKYKNTYYENNFERSFLSLKRFIEKNN